MKLIKKIIKILINFKYKREPFMAWSWGIDDIHEINILTAEYYQDHYRYGTREKWYEAEKEEEVKPIVYGEWELVDDTFDEMKDYKCNLCGQLCAMSIYKMMNFCPNCGADMRKDRKNER